MQGILESGIERFWHFQAMRVVVLFRISIFLPLFLIVLFLTPHSAVATDGSKILLLNSYHQRMPWVAEIVRGAVNVLEPEKNDFSLYIENMDSKEYYSKEYFRSFLQTLKVKYSNIELDLILSSDNNAYDFLRENRDYLFPGVPVVFCGVNNFSDEQLDGLSGFTGVVEVFSARETIELALKIQPGLSTVYVLNDYLKTGRLWAKDIEADLADLANEKHLNIIHSENITKKELLNLVGSFGKDTAILLGAYFSDSNQETFQYEEIAKFLSESSSVPVYSLIEFVIDEGLVGGHVISGYYQGYAMAQLGLNVLIGTDPDVLPVQRQGSNKPILNYEQMAKFSLDASDLPLNVTIINQPFSLYDEYKREILVVLGFIIALIVTILTLILNTIRLRRVRVVLGKSEEQFRQLANATWEAVIIHDRGILLQANELFTEMFGYRQDELVNEPFLDHIFSKESAQDAILRVDVDDFSPYQAVGQHRSGSLFPVEVRIRQIYYKGKEVRVAAIRDISERKEMEEQLAQSQKIEAIGTLAGGIAHDFNNILSAIIGYSELILLKAQRDGTGSASQDDVGKILKAGHRAKTLIQQILTFANKSEKTQEPVQVTQIVMEAMNLIRPSTPASIEIRTELHSESFVLGDPSRIHQVVMNLCTNAIKAMQRGDKLTVSLQDVEVNSNEVAKPENCRAGTYVRITVQDTGVGIPEEIRSRIFDPFFSTRKKDEGTGLGLSVVHGIVKETGGFIKVESGEGEGSCFEVYLPVLKNPEGVDVNDERQLLRGVEKIMLIDDEKELIAIGKEALSSLGYSVNGYMNSLEALSEFTTHPDDYDLVITDMTMPKMNGDELLSSLRSVRLDIPIIICTGYAENFSETDAMKIGVDKFLFKPVDIVTLAAAVRDVLDRSEQDNEGISITS